MHSKGADLSGTSLPSSFSAFTSCACDSSVHSAVTGTSVAAAAGGAASGGPPLAWACRGTLAVGLSLVWPDGDDWAAGDCFWGFGSSGWGPGCWGAFCLVGSVAVPLAVGGCRSAGLALPFVIACTAWPAHPGRSQSATSNQSCTLLQG